MPKVNFKLPLLDEKGEKVMEPKRDFLKMKQTPRGIEAQLVVDADGFVVLEEVSLATIVINTLGGEYEGDDKLPAAERIKRHDILIKVKESDLEGAEFSADELETIRTLAAKNNRTIVLGRIEEAIRRGIAMSAS